MSESKTPLCAAASIEQMSFQWMPMAHLTALCVKDTANSLI